MLLSFCLILCQFQPGGAYNIVACDKKVCSREKIKRKINYFGNRMQNLSAKLRACAPYSLLIRTCASTRFNPHQQAPYVFVLSCVVLLQLKGKVCFVCSLQLIIHLSFLLFYHIKLSACFFSFFYFKPLVTPLFIELFWNKIQVSWKNGGDGLMKTVQL